MANKIASRYFSSGVNGAAVKPNGGSFFGNMTIGATQTNITSRLNVGNSSKRFAPGHIPLAGSPSASGVGASRALSSGNFAIMTAQKYIMYRVTTEVAGIPNSILKAGTSAIGLQRPIHRLEAIRTRGQRAVGWSYVTGQLLSTPSVTVDTFKAIDGTSNIDHAARPSRAVPGEFVFETSAKIPVMLDYSAKTD